jgi:nucleoside-diphosphate-sugar epimerase
LHVDDLADACLFVMANYDGDQLLNVGVGEDVTIRELAELVQRVVGYRGEPTARIFTTLRSGLAFAVWHHGRRSRAWNRRTSPSRF